MNRNSGHWANFCFLCANSCQNQMFCTNMSQNMAIWATVLAVSTERKSTTLNCCYEMLRIQNIDAICIFKAVNHQLALHSFIKHRALTKFFLHDCLVMVSLLDPPNALYWDPFFRGSKGKRRPLISTR